MLSIFPRGVLDEILNYIESVSEGFPSYSFTGPFIDFFTIFNNMSFNSSKTKVSNFDTSVVS